MCLSEGKGQVFRVGKLNPGRNARKVDWKNTPIKELDDTKEVESYENFCSSWMVGCNAPGLVIPRMALTNRDKPSPG